MHTHTHTHTHTRTHTHTHTQQGTEDKVIQIGILSNHSDSWYDAIAEKGNLHQVYTNRDVVIISQAVRTYKPQAQIFELLIERITTSATSNSQWTTIQSAAEIVFVDDTPANVDAAKAVSLQAIHWNNNHHSLDVLVEQLRELGVAV
jgi:FMN phosphatase YigB (HAD superfamily)